MKKINNLKPLGKGSKPIKGNISDNALARTTKIPKDTLISWGKTEKTNWRYNHYWFLKSMSELELLAHIEKSEKFKN